jgi:UDP-N-acetylglucosamine acyltransferase
MEIHPTAVVDSQARIAGDVIIRPYCIIGPEVTIGSGSVIGPHVVIEGWTTIGARNQIHPFTSIGQPPQDVSYAGERTQVIVGDDNIIRENATIHRGTPRGGGATRIGNHNFIMASTHIAHDCVLGNYVIIASGAMLAGHVRIDDYAVVGGLVGVHQYVRIGAHAYIGGMSGVAQDIPPFTLVAAEHATLHGLNITGLRRKETDPAAIAELKKCYRIIFRSGLVLKDAVDKVREECAPLPEVEKLLSFLDEESKRGVIRKL